VGLRLLTPPCSDRKTRLPWKQAGGIILVFLLLLGGRAVRHHLLIGPEGRWRDTLWLDDLIVDPAVAAEKGRPEKPKLTTPLPINTCSVDSLTLLPGVGPVLAGRIAETRDMGVVFCTREDLEEVKGIGPALSARLAPLVILLADTLGALPDSQSVETP
jgi:predicted flap endonuclease-1-like 5' DNA nuclease